MANNFGPPPQYKIGNVVLVAGSADFEVTDGANIGMNDEAAKVAEGDEIYVPSVSKWLTIKAATDNTHGTLIDPCPADCAGTFPLRIRFQAYASRMEGRLATLIATLLKNGNITSLAEADLKTGDFLYADGPGVIKGNPDVQPLHGITDYKTDKAYEKGDLVSFNGSTGRKIYISLKNDNKDLPSVAESWQLIDLGNLPSIPKTYLNRDGQTNFASAAGNATAITADLAKPLEGDFKSGLQVTLGMTNTNTSNATLALNGGTAYPIYNQDNTDGSFMPLTGGEMLANGAYTLTFSKKLNGSAGAWILPRPKTVRSLPAGLVSAFAMESPPDGWLICNGQAVSRAKHADLFTAIGTIHGEGDGSTTFNVPDLQGQFLRGWPGGTDDPDRQFGSKQEDAIRNITGIAFRTVNGDRGIMETGDANGAFANRGFGESGGRWNLSQLEAMDTDNKYPNSINFDASRVVPTANENRPKNVALLFCIKT